MVGSPIAVGDTLVIALSPDGSRLATGQRGGTVEIFDTATGDRIGPSLLGHSGGIWDVEFGPNGRWLASASADGVIAWCRDHMANFKVPRRVEFVDALPVNAGGKVMKLELRERAIAGS